MLHLEELSRDVVGPPINGGDSNAMTHVELGGIGGVAGRGRDDRGWIALVRSPLENSKSVSIGALRT
jgi:hypothetical protein